MGYALKKYFMNNKECFFYLEDFTTQQTKKAIGAKKIWKGDRDGAVPEAIEWLTVNLDQPFSPVFLPFENGPESLELWVPEEISTQPVEPLSDDTARPLAFLNEINPENAYLKSLEKALVQLQSQEYEKIVLARGYHFQKPKDLGLEKILGLYKQRSQGRALIGWQEKLWDNTNEQFIEYGFAANTPECLFSFENGILKSEAVAGTIRRGTSPSEDQELEEALLSCAKTRHEHDCVVKMIVESLSRLGFLVDIGERMIRKLSLIQHVVTPISARGNAHALEIAAALHPTPAVCGYPKNIALANIQSLEPFKRKGYAGSFGWVNSQGEGSFFVGLRGMQWQNDILEVFAGCGIVATSNPLAELDEVNLKLKSIMKVFAYNRIYSRLI